MFVTRLSYQEVEGIVVELGSSKRVTEVQDCDSTPLSSTPLDIFLGHLGAISSRCGVDKKTNTTNNKS